MAMEPSQGDPTPDLRDVPHFKPLDVAAALFASREPSYVLSYLLDTLIEFFRAERGFAIFLSQDGSLDVRGARDCSGRDVEDTEAEFSHTIIEDVAARGESVLIEDAIAEPALQGKSSIVRRGVRSVMCAPMFVAGHLLGAIYIDCLSRKQRFTERDLAVLTLLGSFAGAALHKAHLVGETQEGAPPASEETGLTTLGKMAAGVAHDFNNMLAVIDGRLQLMRKSEAGNALSPDIAKAEEAVHIAEDMAGHLGNLAKACTALTFCEVDLVGVARDAVQLMEYRVERGACCHTLELALPDSLVVEGNPTQLKEMVMNLVANGLDAMPEGGTLSIALRREDTEAVLEVSDCGVGMTPQVLERVWDPFFSTKKGSGTGLGLSVVQAVVERHGGTVTVESAPGRGSTFSVRLPVGHAPRQG